MDEKRRLTTRRLATLAAIFTLAFAVRSLYAVDQAGVMYTPEQTGTRMVQRYHESAHAILAGDGILWPRVRDKERTGLLARPPGYALYLAGVYATLGRSLFAAQLVQNLLTSLACVLIVLAAERLASWPIGVGAGLLAAVSPHLGFLSALVLADALSAVPLMAALLLLARAHPDGAAGWWTSALAGALVGVGVWLRPNVMLLAPWLSLVLLVVLRPRRRGLVHGAALSAAAAACVLPITIRNYVVFGEFVPVSINGGLTLWHGVTEAGGHEAGARQHDRLVTEEEAIRYNNPRYREWWAEPDGIWRDRERYRRAAEVIRANPDRYARVMLGRMGEMLNYASGDAPTVLPTEPSPGAARAGQRFLAPGHAAAVLRPLLRPLQRLVCLVLLPLVVIGTLVLARSDWRRALLLLAIPLYYIVTESFFIYHWRVVAPMHYGLFAAAAATAVAAWDGASRLLSRGRGERMAR